MLLLKPHLLRTPNQRMNLNRHAQAQNSAAIGLVDADFLLAVLRCRFL
jgi:hypothetical protein